MAEGSEIEYDPEYGIAIINDTNVSTGDLRDAIQQQAPEVAALRKWAMGSRGTSRNSTVFQRDKFVSPDNIFDKMRLAAEACRTDDIISNVVETTEHLAYKRIAIECDDVQEMDIWRQIINKLNLSERMREAWREMFTISQCYPAVIYGKKTFRVGKSKKFLRNIQVPIGITFLDPLKVIPVGNFMFNQEKLVYIADIEEVQEFETLAEENTSDLVVEQLLQARYSPSETEKRLIAGLTGQNNFENRLFLLNPENVWRITSTRPSYRRFADIRMESVFELLDLKHLLREMDRAAILGSTNAIILVKRGDAATPARAHELQQISQQMQTASKVPLIVSDHRIEIEIITPDTDKTLAPERYNGLDSRITARMFQVLSTGNYSSGTAGDDSMKLLKVVASSMEARRDQIRDSFMDHIFLPTWEKNDKLKEEPKMAFYPRRIALDFDPTIAQFMQDLRDRGDLSRETILAELDIIQEEEAFKRKREGDEFDDIFVPVNVPYSADGTAAAPTPKAAGRQGGGNKNGGGRNPDSKRPNPAPTKPKAASASIVEEDDVIIEEATIGDDE
jgi:hypothetical protein